MSPFFVASAQFGFANDLHDSVSDRFVGSIVSFSSGSKSWNILLLVNVNM